MVGFLDLEAVVAAPDMASPVRRDVPAVKGLLLLSAGLVPLRCGPVLGPPVAYPA
jgi:hypothetical protein